MVWVSGLRAGWSAPHDDNNGAIKSSTTPAAEWVLTAAMDAT
jgi:hypothetical protein